MSDLTHNFLVFIIKGYTLQGGWFYLDSSWTTLDAAIEYIERMSFNDGDNWHIVDLANRSVVRKR